MSNAKKILVLPLIACLLASFLAGCTPDQPDSPNLPEVTEERDYASSVTLDMTTSTAKLEVTVKSFVDGDTTHFYVPTDVMDNGVLKGRYLAINTPESTGKIEEYGKKAAQFTKERLSSATSIIVESENGTWNPDSTGSRYLVWVWYKTADNADYRNLNIEILQNGLALPNSAASGLYGEAAVAANRQAREHGYNIYSGQKDPDFYYGEAVELTLKELRSNIAEYNGVKVAFNGIITTNSGTQGVYIEDYDAETDMYYGMYIYYGHGLTGGGLEVLQVGNEARIVGTVQYYEAGNSYQVSGLTYRQMKPKDPGNIQKLSDGHLPAYTLTDPDTFVNGKVDVERDEEIVTADYAEMALGTSVEMKNLTVKEVYTTENEDSSSFGAMTLICEADGVTVSVRTVVFRNADGSLVTEDAYLGKTIDVKGIVDTFDSAYQIKVFTADNITITN